jgi:hypothetical protein
MKFSKITISVLVASALIIFVAIMVKYHSPVDIERTCKDVSPPLVNGINSCSLVDQVQKTLQASGYNPVLLENTKPRNGLFRGQFHLQIFEVTNYKIDGDLNIGIAQFSFINGRLSSISYAPTTPDTIIKLYPEKKSESISVRHLTNYQGRLYILWSNDHLEDYIAWWISRFS